jgi:hypothetical protein
MKCSFSLKIDAKDDEVNKINFILGVQPNGWPCGIPETR